MPSTLGEGVQFLDTAEYHLELSKYAGVGLRLEPREGHKFDFLPSDRLTVRAGNRFVHLGDLMFQTRRQGSTDWTSYSTATDRHPVKMLSHGNDSVSYDLSGTLPSDCPLAVTRTWRVRGGHLQLLFDVRNPGTTAVEIGSLGIPMPFNNILTGRSLEEAHAKCSFVDPYIGEDAGYLRVTQLTGTGPTLLVTPVGATPLEAWQLIREPMRPNQTFEGSMEWMVHTKEPAETEWKGVTQWNEPTEAVLKPGESRTYGVQFTPSPSLRKIDPTLTSIGRPVAVGFPGYVLPSDQTGKLFLKYGKRVQTIDASPAGALNWSPNRDGKNGWHGYDIHGNGWGRARLTVTYADGTSQVVSYYVTKPEAEAVADLGHFLTTKSWFTDTDDPFGRAPSAISYDREADAQVRQDSRVWIAGLGDEAGAGNWLALAMKEFGQPNPQEIAKLEAFIDGVLWGNLQFKDGPNKYGVRKSVFYYDPKLLPDFPYEKKFNWTSWTSWSKKATDDVGRGYNYPHVVAAYWAMYRIARNHPGLVKAHPWDWYLRQAYATTDFLTSEDANGNDRVGYWRLGLMDGDVFVGLLEDLRREGWTKEADLIEARMHERADRWKSEPFPFGSEMAWDSTGQEEVYAWCNRFGYQDKALITLNSILAYDPTVPHWGYNGNARRYWDFLYGGKLSRIERQLHHYGSGLNAIPLLNEYRAHPDDLYLLRVGYGGTMGPLSNIDQEGFASAAFHSFPSTLKWDAYSGDYGPNFFGHAWNTGTYLIDDIDFGWQAFGGDVSRDGSWIKVTPKDSFRQRVFIAPLGLYLVLDAGAFEEVDYDSKSKRVRIKLAQSDPDTPEARLRVEQTAKLPGVAAYSVPSQYKIDAGASTIPLSSTTTAVTLSM
ncbi:MAG TPA: DUF5695 domain-containing protein [Fimbriimonas sp.]|nr:DUF5695 domain-containing protein [Fimbriimonas sp.]